MEKQEHKSKWDELAREIGADISPETERREQAVSTTTDSPTSAPKRPEPTDDAVRPPLPKKQAANWNMLAGELGLPPIPEDEPVAVERPPQAEQRPVLRESLTPSPKADREEQIEEQESSTPQREQARERSDRGERGGRGGQPRDSQRQDGERPGQRRGAGRGRREEGGDGREVSGRGRSQRGRGRQESGRGRDETRGGRDEQQRRREPRESRERDEQRSMEFTEEVQEVTEVESIQIESTPAPPAEPPAKSPAVSLWHKIFGSPAEQTAKMPEPAPSEPAWNDDLYSESSTVSRDELFAATGEEELVAGEFDDMATRGERTDFAEGEAPSDELKRGRSRRRRRGGRGRKPGERQSERAAAPLQQESEGIEDLGVELDVDDDADDSATFEDGADPLGSDLDIDDGDGEPAELGGRRGSAAQRAIPSWDEAIGFIVDTNMQSRSQRRPAPRSGSGPRGRSRGRRKN